MKDFFKMFLAALAATFVYGIISFISTAMMFAMMMSLGSSVDSSVDIQKNSVLKFDISAGVTDRSETSTNSDILDMSFNVSRTLGLDQIKRSLDKAKTDDRISALYLDLDRLSGDISTFQAIRQMLVDFKECGKPIIAFRNGYSLGSYYFASVADRIYMRPNAMFEITGLSSATMYYKPILDKLGITCVACRHGKFKSAIEPYTQEKMSDANRLQTQKLLDDLWGSLISDISESRSISVEDINKNVDDLSLLFNDSLCIEKGFINGLMSKDDVMDTIKVMINKSIDDDLKMVSLSDYYKSLDNSKELPTKIAVIYACGEIQSKDSKEQTVITAKKTCDAIKKCIKDDDIKAVVLRINSPGGDADEAEEIYQSLLKLKDTKKPIVVSMGDYAASGGYYIACPADSIYAMPTTITGSIGVFSLIPNLAKLYNMVDLNVEVVKTNKHSDLLNEARDIDNDELAAIQGMVEKTYHTFISHVADGRNMTLEQVDSIGQGRVWSGVEAINIGLVDKLGNLDDAINTAANLADIKSWSIVNYPEIIVDPMDDLLMNLLNSNISTDNIIFDDIKTKVNEINKLTQKGKIQCLMPPMKIEMNN